MSYSQVSAASRGYMLLRHWTFGAEFIYLGHRARSTSASPATHMQPAHTNHRIFWKSVGLDPLLFDPLGPMNQKWFTRLCCWWATQPCLPLPGALCPWSSLASHGTWLAWSVLYCLPVVGLWAPFRNGKCCLWNNFPDLACILFVKQASNKFTHHKHYSGNAIWLFGFWMKN